MDGALGSLSWGAASPRQGWGWKVPSNPTNPWFYDHLGPSNPTIPWFYDHLGPSNPTIPWFYDL